jgi:hypothetical protein
MTKEEAIEYLKQDIEGDLNGRVNIAKKTLKKILDAFNDEPTDDIPIGAPCEAIYEDGDKCLTYYAGNGISVSFINDISSKHEGIINRRINPLTIWDIPEKYGGAPEWATYIAIGDRGVRMFYDHEPERFELPYDHPEYFTIECRPKE